MSGLHYLLVHSLLFFFFFILCYSFLECCRYFCLLFTPSPFCFWSLLFIFDYLFVEKGGQQQRVECNTQWDILS